MKRIAAALAALVLVAGCGDEEAEKAAVAHWSALIDLSHGASHLPSLAARVAQRAKAVAALDEFDKKFKSTSHAKDTLVKANADGMRKTLAAEQAMLAALPCQTQLSRACLLAEAEKRIQVRSEHEMYEVAMVLAATGERRLEQRLLALIAAGGRVDSIEPIIVLAGVAKSAAALEALDTFGRKQIGYERITPVLVAYARQDKAAYAAEIERLRADGQMNVTVARSIGEYAKDSAIFAEAIRLIRASPAAEHERASDMGITIHLMARAGLAEDVWALAATTEPPLPDAVFAFGALARVAGDRRDAARVDALLAAGVKPANSNAPIKPALAGYIVVGPMAYALARLGRIDEATAMLREGRVSPRGDPAIAFRAIAVHHAQQGNLKAAIDALYVLEADEGPYGNLTNLIAGLLEIAAIVN